MSVCKSSRMGKIEKPRPLRSTSITTTTSVKGVDDVLVDLERVCQMLTDERFSPALSTAITSLWYHIKLMGHQMEYACKDDLDRQFGHLRNACRDERLDRASRVRLLELIELRAQRTPWTANDNISTYYTQMLLMIEGQQMCDGDVVDGGGAPQLPALLTAGEVVRGSGKYPRPTKIQGRYKDEVVIRNSDSGKALHGAKERMVQISGETEDNVLLARGLMDDVIRRNASPVLDHCGGGGGSLLGSTGDGSLSYSAHSPNTSDSDHHQLNDAGNGVWPAGGGGGSLGEFRYTVFVNGHAIKLSCKDADAIKAAKVVLDEYFTNGFQTQPQRNPAKLVSNTPTGQLNVSRGMSGGGECVSPTDLLLADAFLATSSPFTAEAPPTVAATSADNMLYNNSYDSTPPSSLDLDDVVACAPADSPCPPDVVDAVEYRRYDRSQLLVYSASAVARYPPLGWTTVQSRLPDIARATARKFDVDDFLVRSYSVPPLLLQQRRRSSGSNSDPAGYGTVGPAENPSGL